MAGRRPQALPQWAVGVAVDKDHNERTVVERRDPLLGEVFDRRFRVSAKVAAGGFGAIYRATHIKSGHEFALKVLHANLTSDPRVVARFRREGAALTRLRDPHTITAYELGEAGDGTLYLVMELLRGESLFERFRARGPLPWQRVIAIARAVCSSLAEAHAHGIIHRDLKPTNIHLEPRGSDGDFVKVLDFGIAKILQGSDIDSSDLTSAGQMIGTLDYMSPEQMVGGLCTATSDIYTLGIVMYEMIAGKKPFDDANSATAALAAVLTTTPERLSTRALVTPEVDHVVMRCLERQHTDRFQTADELAAALDEILGGGDELVTTVANAMHGSAVVARPAPSGTEATSPIPKPAPAGADATQPIHRAAIAAAEATSPIPRVAPPEGDTTGPNREASSAANDATAPIPRFAPSVVDLTPSPSEPGAFDARATVPIAGVPGFDHDATLDFRPGLPGSRPAPSLAKPALLDLDATLVGHLGPTRRPATLQQPSGAALGTASMTARSLRDSYPTIHRPPPSPVRPAGFDDRQTSAVSHMPYDMSRAVRRDAAVRRLAVAIGIAVGIVVAIALATRF